MIFANVAENIIMLSWSVAKPNWLFFNHADDGEFIQFGIFVETSFQANFLPFVTTFL